MSKSIQDRLKKLEALYRCLCINTPEQGPVGPPGPQGPQGSAAEACPDHFKLAAVSGTITSNSKNAPDLTRMHSGNDLIGWSYGNYNVTPAIDGFGNLIRVKFSQSFIGIPLPIDLNEGDTVRITGIAYTPGALTGILNPKFYVTVSHFHCEETSFADVNVPFYTVIPVASYDIPSDTQKICFSESINLGSVLPSTDTFFVVGLGVGQDNEVPTEVELRFSYSLDVTQACIGTGGNLLIRNCCDPAYSEIIIDNGTPVGESFVDNEGNCWTVESITLDSVNSIRALGASYPDGIACIADNPCPQNFEIQSCCGDGSQIFSAALIGVNVGDTFVDTNGFCWSAVAETAKPITNVVDVDVVYPETTCESAECVTANDCPDVVNIASCCNEGVLEGHTTLELLQAAIPTITLGSTFVDTFGMCWVVRDAEYTFPNLSFIVPAIDYGLDACETCITANECPRTFYYTIQNCCTEEIEVVVLASVYDIDETLILQLSTGFGCYEILSWSDTGIATATVVNVEATVKNCNECLKAIEGKYGNYCAGKVMCCTPYTNQSKDPQPITGYKCDGTWVSNLQVLSGQTICMAQVVNAPEAITKGGECCSFDVLNPSLTQSMVVYVETCLVVIGEVTIPPNTLLSTVLAGIPEAEGSTCASCIRRMDDTDNDFVYVPCV